LKTLPWLSLPVVGLRYWLVWDRLPARMATHFDLANRPNGWMSRGTALVFTLVLMVFLLSTLTIILQRVRMPDLSAGALLGIFYVIVGFLYSVDGALLDYNLYGRPLDIGPPVAFLIISILVFMTIFLGAKRGASLPDAGVIAEEVHASRMWSLLFVALLFVELAIATVIPVPLVRFALALLCLLFVLIAAQAWTGFRYEFRTSGVEIRTLGFRLRSIPRDHIKEYKVEKWNPLGGYGIRGIGENRAYVWGNKGVRIKTTNGEVFLGHSEPERIVHDLDVIKQFARS
jgi:hypothetical protein